MCLTLYLATAGEQPLRKSPELTIEAVEPYGEPVRQWFSLPAVRFIGAHTGCSCGFRHVVAEEPVDYREGMFDGPDAEQNLRSTQALVALIHEHVASGEVQLYPVWNGDEQLAPKGTIELRAGTLDPDTFFLNERFFYRVLADAGIPA